MTILRQVIESFTKDANTMRPPVSAGGSLLLDAGSVAGVPMNRVAQLGAMGTVPWLFAVIDRIATAVAASEWSLFRKQPDGDRKEVFDHPLLTLWNSINPFYTLEEFLEVSQQHFDLTGEMWWVVARMANGKGAPAELWPVRPDRMRPVPHPEQYIAGYEYRIGSTVINLEPRDVIFKRRPHPLDPYRGIGTVQALMVDIEAERMSTLWTRNFFRNSAEPGGIIELEDDLDDEAYERFVARWREQHQGVANAHRVAVLERGTWKDRKLTQRDMQFEQLRKLNRDTMLGAFGMPASILGVAENVNRANAEAAEVMFSRWVVRPRLQRIRGMVNKNLAPLFGPDLWMGFTDPTPENRELNLDEAERGIKAQILTRNEARARLGEGEVDGGDEFVAPPAGGGGFGAGLQGYETRLWPGFKAQDPLERSEHRARQAWQSRLEVEGASLVAYLEAIKNVASWFKIEVSDLEGYDWDWWAKYGDEVIDELHESMQISVARAAPEMAAERVQEIAARYAEHRGARLLRLDGDLNLVNLTRRRVNDIVASAVERGDSLGTIQKALREDFAFSPDRARVVARTETATALGQGAKEVALVQGRDEKRWITQGDANVTIECASNEAAGWISIADVFPSGVDTIPQHPNCRCNVRYRTKEQEASRTLAEARCPNCDKLLGTDSPAGLALYCRRCKKKVEPL